ncbi:polyprenol phosphomannose-dependent alpha 1,6 mannosyltransferase MptB [Skermania piniformis]
MGRPATLDAVGAVDVGRRVLGLVTPAPERTVAALHGTEAPAPGLNPRELIFLQHIRWFGTTGSLLMAFGALGVGAQPVRQNPTFGIPVLSLPARMQTSAIAVTMIGTVIVVLAWLLLGRYAVGRFADGTPPRRLSRGQLDRTLLLWIIPLAVAPPMFSQDIYSYLAQGEIAHRGLDPYALGPEPALGRDHVLTNSVPNIWKSTPAPYGPLFVWCSRGIAAVAGDNIVAGIWLHRALALGGVALIVWALPRLARRCGVAAVSALWLGAANPLLLFHLVAGVHNEALMLGLMLAGMELALHAIESAAPIRGTNLTLLIGGCAIIALSSTIKIPSLVALGFVGMALARRWGHGWRGVLAAAAATGGIALTTTLLITTASGLGFGWVHTLGAANAVRSWMSLPTLIGILTGFGGVVLGLGDHTTAVLNITRPIAAILAMFVTLRMLLAVYTGRLHPVGAFGVAMGSVILLFPVVQPWYLLWAVTPLAAWATLPAFRIPTIALSALVSVILMPRGAEFTVFQIVAAAAATVVVVAGMIIATRTVLPWRVDDAGAPKPFPHRTPYAERP